MRDKDTRPEVVALFANLKAELSSLDALLKTATGHWGGEDGFYRFYHQSFKVFHLQNMTKVIVASLQGLAPKRTLNPPFAAIIADGTNKTFSLESNEHWSEETRPILEAFFHARTMLEFAVKYGTELEEPPACLPSGWAAFLYLYNLR